MLRAGETRPGDPVMACGSPFGILAPAHFAASVLSGSVSGMWRAPLASYTHAPPSPPPPPLLMVDMRVLPGMEGGPVLDTGGRLLGVLTPPLVRWRAAGDADGTDAVPLVLTVESIRGALASLASIGRGGGGGSSGNASLPLSSPPPPPPPPRMRGRAALDITAARSVVLIETNGGTSWASAGTSHTAATSSAETICPWRSLLPFTSPPLCAFPLCTAVVSPRAVLRHRPYDVGVVVSAGDCNPAAPTPALILTNAHVVHPSAVSAGGDGRGLPVRSVRVRVPGPGSGPRWRVARVVYLSSGSLDVAVLSFAVTHEDRCWLRPASLETSTASPAVGTGGGGGGDSGDGAEPHGIVSGAPVAVIGHARIGPRAESIGGGGGGEGVVYAFSESPSRREEREVYRGSGQRAHTAALAPSVTLGVITSVVCRTSRPGEAVMVQTSAAVHAGASGGAVVSPNNGRLLALVTSNARHGGGGLHNF